MKVVEIALDLIDEDTEQPRQNFDDSSIDELVDSISKVGLLSPIKVYETSNGRYKIIFGNRRYKALKKLGFHRIPCIISSSNNELDIYLEQLTENIQRENFTPIEEAMAFQKLLENDGKWKISLKYLSSKLGKQEKYISNKLSLLVFGAEVRKIIHNGTEIIAGQLSEEQALSIKDVPVEYRDQIAVKVANDQRSVKDVKRIAQLFSSPDRSSKLKEKLLDLTCHELVAISIENELYSDTKKSQPPQIVSSPIATSQDFTDDKFIENFIIRISPLQEEVNRLILKVPSYNPMPQDLVDSISEMQIEERGRLLDSIRILVKNFEDHLNEWKSIKATLEKNSNFRKEIRLVKTEQ